MHLVELKVNIRFIFNCALESYVFLNFFQYVLPMVCHYQIISSPKNHEAYHILYLQNDEIIRCIHQYDFLQLNYNIDFVSTTKEALAHYYQSTYDLILIGYKIGLRRSIYNFQKLVRNVERKNHRFLSPFIVLYPPEYNCYPLPEIKNLHEKILIEPVDINELDELIKYSITSKVN